MDAGAASPAAAGAAVMNTVPAMKSQVGDFLTTTRESITYTDRHDVTCPARGGRGGHISPTCPRCPARHPLGLPPPRRSHELRCYGTAVLAASHWRQSSASLLGIGLPRFRHQALAPGSGSRVWRLGAMSQSASPLQRRKVQNLPVGVTSVSELRRCITARFVA
jgi:hypothetical protein